MLNIQELPVPVFGMVQDQAKYITFLSLRYDLVSVLKKKKTRAVKARQGKIGQ